MISFSKRFVHESGPYLRTRASRATITGLRAPDFTTLDVDWGPWTVLAEIASRDDPGPFVGRSSRLNASPGPQRSAAHGHVTQSRLLIRAKPYRHRSGCLGGFVWTTVSAPSSVTLSTWTGSCARNDTSFAAALAVCSEADSKSGFGLSQRTLNFGIRILLST